MITQKKSTLMIYVMRFYILWIILLSSYNVINVFNMPLTLISLWVSETIYTEIILIIGLSQPNYIHDV